MKQKTKSLFTKNRSQKLFVIGLLSLCIPVAMAKMPPPGKLFDIGGYKMHLDCRGENLEQPTIILESGAGDNSITWGLVQDELAKHTKVCSYDRSGFGWSERSGKNHGPKQVADELHTLLQVANVKPPYIMVGHSLGGLYVQTYAAIFPQEINSIVLVEPTHEDEISRYAALLPARIKTEYTFGQKFFIGTAKFLIPFGIPKLITKSSIETYPQDLQEKYKATLPTNRNIRSNLNDALLLQSYYKEAREIIGHLGAKPLVVMGAGKIEKPPTWSEEEFTILLKARREMLIEISQRSSNGRFVLATESNHFVQWKQPDFVIHQILSIINK